MKRVAVFVVLIVGSLQAGNYYVSTNGDDSRNGAINKPWRTIQHAVNTVGAGDTVYVRGGTYHEEIKAANLHGNNGDEITITNYNNEEVVIDGSQSLADLGGGTWTQEADTNIYKTTINKDVWQLWVDGRMAVVARWPNVTVGHPCDDIQFKADGYTPVQGSWWDIWGTWGHMNNSWNATGDLINDTLYHDMAAENVSFAGGSIVLNFHSESQFARPIISHTAGTSNLTYTPVQNPHDKGQGHFLIEADSALDMPGEWYYNKDTGEVRLWCEDGQSPQGRDVRGKTISYAFDIDDASYLTIKGIDFFGCALNFPKGSHVTVEDCNFSYPTWYRRMLGEYGYQGEPTEAATQPPETGSFFFQGLSGSTYYNIANCKFEYSDGMVYMKTGFGNEVDNCSFHHFSFTGMSQMILMANSNKESVVKRSTFHTNGSKVMVKHTACDIEWCNFMYFGYFQMDGTAMQCAGGDGPGGGSDGTVRHHNWHHQAYKTGCRWDGDEGVNGSDHHFVSWNTPSSMNIKGDYHKVINNTSVALHDPLEPGIKMTDANPLTDPKNQNSDVYNNLADGISSDTHSYVQLTGNNSSNWNGFVDSTGANDRAADRIRDAVNWDFRPTATSGLVDAGVVYSPITDGYIGSAPDIGAYEYGDTNYWIPGRKDDKASTPIPLNGSLNAKPDCDLMWLEGKDADSHDVYFGKASGSLEFKGNQTNNIFDPNANGLTEGQMYFWRIDTVTSNGTITGDEWSFTAQQPLDTFYVDIYPVADTYTRNDNPDSNYGTETKLSITTHEDGNEREGYIKFNVSVPGPIVSANLNLYATGASTSGNVQVYSMSDTSWNELTLTYNNAPSIDGVLLDQQDIYSLSYRGFNVLNAVSGNGLVSLGIDRSLTTSYRGISSRENENPPYLTLAYTSSGGDDPIPDPPANLSAVGSAGQISLDWDDNTETDIQGYQVLRRQNPDDNFVQLHPGLITASEYVDTTMLYDLLYEYIVKAVDVADQFSYQSDIAVATASEPVAYGSADINGDGDVNLEDLEVVSRNWEKTCVAQSWCEGADLDYSGKVELADLQRFATSWLE
ncbi:MAG: DNRLRE domain-containing protein [Phycisphaerae bacterium]|nr:DNRLRE domain-containing protein [Phycisphaerae bacterium]